MKDYCPNCCTNAHLQYHMDQDIVIHTECAKCGEVIFTTSLYQFYKEEELKLIFLNKF